ncbi:Hypothetical protein D9617_29g007090 [Elsinoe fawcettii]|nr:Hypothetical protein D9617_29g007090 [Elsinoe fawcettii]
MATAVLQHVTNKKLAKLQAQQIKFEGQKEELLNYQNKDAEVLQYSQRLLKGIKKMQLANPGTSLMNIELFLKQAEHDTSVPAATISQWRNELEKLLAVRSSKYAYASLFGRLVTEWLENPNDANRQHEKDSDFEHVGRQEMHDQRKTWESIVFAERKVNVGDLTKYLTKLFGSAEAAVKSAEVTPLDTLRRTMKRFQISSLDTPTLKDTIDGVIKSDLFAGEKRDALLDLKDRDSVLAEVVDVLNMSLKPLKDWSWEQNAIPVSQRRQINGKYRFFMDEEIHQALLVHFIGSELARHVKAALEKFVKRAWYSSNTTTMSEEDVKRRAYFLRQTTRSGGQMIPELDKPKPSLGKRRETEFKEDYFLTQMPDILNGGTRDYNGEDEGETTSGKDPVDLKQDLMEMMTTDMLIDLDTNKKFCVLQSDFKWFGPSLPHATILELLRFFGFKDYFITFCKTFLEAPLAFAQDGPDAAIMVRKSGAPMSHALSDVMGELILFCLDHAVNIATQGRKLYRLHDDLWFWGSGKDCQTAWKVIQQFTTKTGLQLNDEKSGSCYMTHESMPTSPRVTASLPQGQIKWGFLILSPTTRKWEIDLTQVHSHITELRLQLSACRSVFAFIQAWNSYVSRFFTNNFGRAANCHGNSHLRSVISTFELIQRELFPSGSATSHIKSMISQRFHIPESTIPTGFLYFPTELGGLDLKNPFISLLARLHEPSTDVSDDESLASHADSVYHTLDPGERLRLAALRERHDYDTAKARWEKDGATFPALGDGWRPRDHGTFFSYEEYSAFRRETSFHLVEAATQLRGRPEEKAVQVQGEVQGLLGGVMARMGRSWAGKGYNKWILALYGPEMVGVFGGLEVGDRELLPVGLVKMLRGERGEQRPDWDWWAESELMMGRERKRRERVERRREKYGWGEVEETPWVDDGNW